MFYNMRKVCLILLLSALVAVKCAVDVTDVKVLPFENITTPAPGPSPTSTTTSKPTPTPTPKPTDPTTPKPTPTPTPKPTDPTTPKTTPSPTPKPTDPTTPKTTPSPTPTPTPTPKPTEPPKPTPAPLPPKPVDPETGTWSVNNTNSDNFCLVVKFALQIQVPYTVNNKSLIQPINIPVNASKNGTCTNTTQTITLTWKENNADNVSQSMCLNFAKNDTAGKYYLEQVDVHLTPNNGLFPGLNENKTINFVHKQSEFATSISKSYKCDKKQDFVINVTEPVKNVEDATVYISHFQFQAFENATKADFTSSEDCESSSSTPDVVPIAVGVSMALLIIVVFFAYLIGKRRRQARGYLSMFAGTKKESEYIPMKHLSCFQ